MQPLIHVQTIAPNIWEELLSMEHWDPALAERELRRAFEATRENVVEVNLQELHTVRGEPHRLTEWTRMALRLAEEYA